jgi:hypothetical protein
LQSLEVSDMLQGTYRCLGALVLTWRDISL